MADDSLRQFYNRAARTLSIAYEVLQKLKASETDAEAQLTRLELDLDGWEPELNILNCYKVENGDYITAIRVWRHSNIGPKPEAPEWPRSLPDSEHVEKLLKHFGGSATSLVGLRFNIAQIRESLKESWGIGRDMPAFDLVLNVIALVLDNIKAELERNNTERSTPEPALTQQPAIVDELVTLDQVAPLTGLTKRTLERYLERGELPEPDVQGGGGRSHKWFWRNFRPGLEKVSRRQLPERFPGSRIV